MENKSFISAKSIFIILCIIFSVLLTSCTKETEKETATQAVSTSPATNGLEEPADLTHAQTLDFDIGNLPETGVSKNGSIYSIKKGGVYIIKGTLEGQLCVDADKEDVWLLLDNAHITCTDSSPLYIADAKNTYLVLCSGSENTLTDTDSYKSGSDDPDATLFCKNDLFIGGTGELTIDSNFNNALHTKDTLCITEGTITIDSVDTGIKAKDGLTVSGGSLSITAVGDAMQTTNSEDNTLGNINITGGNFNLKSEKDAIQSENSLTVSSGSFDILTGSGAENADYQYSSFMAPPGYMPESSTDSVSMKGLKSQGELNISGGKFTINSEDDAIHSNASVNITGGVFSIMSGDDGIHADEILTVSDGEINVTKSYEGLEGTEVNISGGNIRVTSTDDGINSAGGGDTYYGGFGRDSFSNSSYCVKITDGYVYVDAQGDGIDSNGNLYFMGGTVIIHGPENSGNSPIDWENECKTDGGTLIAFGSADMMGSVSSSSAQCSLGINFSNTLKEGTLCNISSADAYFNLTLAVKKNSSYLLISTPDLSIDTTYKIYTGGTHSGTDADGLYSNGNYSDGTHFADITQSSTATTYGSAFGGMGTMGPGGMGTMGPGGMAPGRGGRW